MCTALLACLPAVQPLLIENIEEELDPVLDAVLERRLVKKGKSWVLQLADKEVRAESLPAIPSVGPAHTWGAGRTHTLHELCCLQVDFTDSFKLFCTTRLPNPHFTPELSAKVTVVDFTVTMAGESLTRSRTRSPNSGLEEPAARYRYVTACTWSDCAVHAADCRSGGPAAG